MLRYPMKGDREIPIHEAEENVAYCERQAGVLRLSVSGEAGYVPTPRGASERLIWASETKTANLRDPGM